MQTTAECCDPFNENLKLKEKLAKIESDINNGLKFKAAGRLRNMINQYPNEAELWNRLAELYYESGFLDSAGRYWILTEPKDERIKKCVEVYEKSVNYSVTKILRDITFRGDKTKLSEYGQRKLTELELDSQKKSNYIPKYAAKTNKKQRKHENEKQTFKDKVYEKIFFGTILTIGLLILIGFVTVIKWLF